MSFTALIAKKKAGLLPDGWISKVYKPGEHPTEYERSPHSPWKIKTFNENPLLQKPMVLNRRGKLVKDRSEVHIFRGNELKKMKVEDAWEKRKHSQGHAPPPHLKKSSLIWDYGPGRTYGSPQAALDALIAFQGVALFTETHYIRGWSGTFQEDEDVLHVHDLFPDSANGHLLIIDVEDGEEVVWQGGDSGSTGPTSDAFDGVDNYTIRDVKIRTTNPNSFGIAVSQYNPSGQYYYRGDRLFVEDVKIDFVGVDNEDTVAFMLGGTARPTISRVVTNGHQYAAPDNGSGRNDYAIFMMFRSSVLDAVEEVFLMDVGANQIQFVGMGHCLCRAQNGSLISQIGDQLLGVFRLSCIVEAGSYILDIIDKPLLANVDLQSDGNVYKYGIAFGVDKGGTFTLPEYRAQQVTDEHSYDNVDPLVDWDSIHDGLDDLEIPISVDSIVWQNGRTITGEDFYDRPIDRDLIDIGPFQSTGFETALLCGYCTENDVITFTGVEPKDLDVSSSRALNTILCEWIAEATEIIDRYTKTTFELTAVPSGIRNICTRMVAAYTTDAIQNRKTRAVRIDEIDKDEMKQLMLSDEIKEMLTTYVVEPQIDTDNGFTMGAGIITRKEEDV